VFSFESHWNDLDFSSFKEKDLVKILFSEKPAVIIQSHEDLSIYFKKQGIKAIK